MNDDLYERVSRIDFELGQLRTWLHGKRDFDTASRLIPIADELIHLVAEISVEKKRKTI